MLIFIHRDQHSSQPSTEKYQGWQIIPGQKAENKILWGAQFYMEQPYDILSSEDLGVMSGDRSERLFETGC